MKKSYSGYLYIILCTLIFSLVEVALKKVSGIFHPMQITALRFFIGGITLLPFAIHSMRERRAVLRGKDYRFFALLGFLFICLAMCVFQTALSYTNASAVAVLFSCNPIFVTVLAHLILDEPIRKNHVIALFLELIAALFIIDPIHVTLNPVGCILALVAAVIFAFYSVFGKRQTSHVGGIAVTCLASLFGSAELMLLLFVGQTDIGKTIYSALHLTNFIDVPIFSGIPASALLWLFYIGAISTGFGFVCHMLAMEKTSAQEASLIFLMKPMLAPIFALILLKEEITANMWIGIACFLIGSGIAVIPGLIEQRKRIYY